MANKNKKTKKIQEVIIRIKQEEPKTQAIIPLKESDLLPEKQGGRYMIPKTWMSEKQVVRLIQVTPKQFVKTRKGKAGMTFDYVPGSYFKRVLNCAFGWNWDFKIIKQEVFGLGQKWGQVITTGELTVKDDAGHTIVKQDNGKSDIKYLRASPTFPMDLGNDFKASATDCLKRCAAQLGIASDVYGRSEVKEDIGEDVSNPVMPTMPVEKKESKEETPKFCLGNNGKGCPEGNVLTEAELGYSMRFFKKPLCRTCQKEIKK